MGGAIRVNGDNGPGRINVDSVLNVGIPSEATPRVADVAAVMLGVIKNDGIGGPNATGAVVMKAALGAGALNDILPLA